MMVGINIYSGERGLGGALTNPTVLSRRKGMIDKSYPIKLDGREYPDVESAYHMLKTGDIVEDDEMMAIAIAIKFQMHPALWEEVRALGGVDFLASCTHWTTRRDAEFKALTSSGTFWEGAGLQSRFIRNLIRGYELAESGGSERLVVRQDSLF